MNAPFDFEPMRTPPHHLESEQGVLGALMRDNAVMDCIELAEADFYTHAHRLIWKAVTGLIDAGKPADVITVSESLEASGDLAEVGGLPYIVSLTDAASESNARHYAKSVRDRAMLRKLAEAGNRIADLAHSGRDIGLALAEAQQAVMEIDTAEASSEAVILRDSMRAVIERIDRRARGEEKHTATGFTDLDRKIVGMAPGDMIVVAGRPSMGKTAFAVQIAEHVSQSEPVLVFSLEMDGEALTQRQIASVGKVDLMQLRKGELDDDGWQRITYATAKLKDRRIYIDDRAGLSMRQIRARARQTKRKHGLGLIVIDYIGLIRGEGNNRTEEVSAISREIKNMARELGVPVIALSQLNRGVEQRTDKHPMMSDLRESGSIEQDADVIILLYRDEYYHPDSDAKGIAECIVSKQRNGPTGIVPLTFLPEYARFENFSGRWEQTKPKQAKRGFE